MDQPTTPPTEPAALLLEARPHPIGLLQSALLAGLLALVLYGFTVVLQTVLALDWNRVPYLRAAFVAMLPLGIGLRDLLVWARTRYCLTTDSLTRAGPHPATWPLSEIETVELRQSLPERWLKFGDLRLFTAGDPGVVYLEKLTSPERLQRALLEQLTRQDRTLRSAIPELIAGLDQLRRTGALSEAEFQAQKERLLRQL